MVVHHTRPSDDVYLTNINAYITNSSPAPCYLTGDPQAVLVRHGQPLPGRYQRAGTEIDSDDPTPAALSAATSILAPGAIVDEVIGWVGPYCHHAIRAAVRIPLVLGSVETRESVPSPPCGGAGPAVINTGPWVPMSF
jgi:hypothetical protein